MIKNTLFQTDLKTKDFYFDLPKELIAQHPTFPRDHARLLACDIKNQKIQHKIFYDIIDYLNPGDVLVINDSKVIPARIYGKKISSGESFVEFLLLKQLDLDTWEVIVKPGKRLKTGAKVNFGDGLLISEIIDVKEDGNRIVHFSYDKTKGDNIFSILDKIGHMPLPPYITEELKNNDDYQTVYANEMGSSAAPTAGLHFTNELLDKIQAKGVDIVKVMLHVGLGTFRPVKVDNILEHTMHSEYFSVSKDSADRINKAKSEGHKVICCGTTSCRTIESACDDNGIIHPMCDDTGIFIYPGYKFKMMDALITNFHLPESTLVMLVSAFAGKDFTFKAYEEAIKEKYKFFSFGDATLWY